jgi:hypothetical protein
VSKKAMAAGAVVVFLAALIYFWSYVEYGLAYDEGYLLDGVEKLLDGQLIYRDFHHTYAPGRFYLVALAFNIFGKSLLVERSVFIAFQALKCMLGFLVVYGITRSKVAFLAPVLIAMAPGPWHKVFFSSVGFLATFAVIISFHRRPKALALTGIVLGCCAVFRQDVAGFATLGALLALLIDGLTEHPRIKDMLLRSAYLVGGILVVGGPVLLYFHSQGALEPMIHKIAVDGMRDNMTNVIPYPGLTAALPIDWRYVLYVLPVKLLFYLPFIAYGAAVVPVLRALRLRRWNRSITSLLVVLVISVLAFNQSIWRSDVGHLLQSMQYVFLLIPLALGFAFRRLTGRRGTLLKVILLMLPLAFVVWASFGIVSASTDYRMMPVFAREGISVGDVEYLGSVAVRAGNDTRLDLERAPVYVRPGEARFFHALGRFLDMNTSPGDYVLAVPQLQLLYFLYDRRNPVRYAHYRRALEPEEEVLYIEDIVSHHTEYVLLTEPYEGAIVAQTKGSFSEYGRRVRQWILDNYTLVDRLGAVQVLKRKP